MKINSKKIQGLIDKLMGVNSHLELEEKKYKVVLKSISGPYHKSARNLIHYHAIRHFDLRRIQSDLRNLGMSRFNNATGHVKASLINTQHILSKLIGGKYSHQKSGLSIKNGIKLLNNHTSELLGPKSKGRRVRIMVTLPTEAAINYGMVCEMVRNGMNCARINCAHDNPEVWKAIIDNVKKAEKELARKVVIAMDLGGPKIRTGEIESGPQVRKLSPKKDDYGNVIKPASLILVSKLGEDSLPNEFPIGDVDFSMIAQGDLFSTVDARDKLRDFKVIEVTDGRVVLSCINTVYLATGSVLKSDKVEVIVGYIPPKIQSIPLKINDLLEVHQGTKKGSLPIFSQNGDVLEYGAIYCDYPELFEKINQGDPIMFDDGKIEGVVEDKGERKFSVRIKKAKLLGSNLKAEKGINVPNTLLQGGLTAKDKEDLRFVAKHADVVNYSFVNRPHDVVTLIGELEKLGVKDRLNIILKIETQLAFDNLKEILLVAMRTHFIGVMIARGDLAVETGWNKIGWVQREILQTCTAAHIPVIWATQVLENLAKKGLPSRSEITDATTSLKAECVMLNKGPYINDAIKLLDQILSEMEDYHEKNENMLPKRRKLIPSA